MNRLATAISATLLGSAVAFAIPASAQDRGPLVVGHDVVDAVDDVRETTADLIGALMEAREGLGFVAWEQTEAQLDRMEEGLEEMEVTLDRKAEATDDEWLEWVQDTDYGVTIEKQVSTIASYLDAMANMLAEAKGGGQSGIVVGHNVVDQVDDLRETTADLLQAMATAGPQFGWDAAARGYTSELQRLEAMERELDKKAEMTDAQWGTFFGSPEYRVMIRDDIAELSEILNKAI